MMNKMTKPAKPVTKTKKVKKVKKVRAKRKVKIREAKDVGTSKIEKEFEKWLIKNGILVEEQYKINYKFYDFKVKDEDVLLEFQGTYWHCDPRQYPNGPINKMQEKAIVNDKYKKILAKGAGFLLIEIWESDFKNDPVTVKKYIKEKIKEFKISQKISK